MALIIKDRVKETSTTTGTGAFTLAGAVTGFRAFSSVCTTNDTCYYCIEAVDASGTPTGEWETGLGTYSAANTLTRTTFSDSSTGSAINFAAGTKNVYIDLTASSIAKAVQARVFEGTLTRDLTTASGGVTVTGLGFKPRVIRFYAVVDTTLTWSIGSGAIGANSCIYSSATVGQNAGGHFAIVGLTTATTYQSAVVSATGTDGFTLTWTKTSTPTGSMNIYYIAEE